MSLESIPGQPRTKRFLKQLFRSGHIPHALLFSGMTGIGKTAMALELAKLLNCQAPRDLDCCDVCPSCRKIHAGHHPDVVPIEREGAFIKIDQIRSLQTRFRFRPFEGNYRVVILQNAHQLTEEAANALLKMLEEPPKHNVLVLTTLEPQMLLPTLVSRCSHVRFEPLEESWIEQHLMTVLGVAHPEAARLARVAEGSLDQAVRFLEEDRLARWEEISAQLESLQTLPMLEFFSHLNQWVQKTEDLEQDMECIKLWLRDLICSRLLSDYQPVFPFHEALWSAACRVPAERLFVLYDHMEQAVQHLRQNANKQLTLEGVCLAIKDGLHGQSSWNSFPPGRQNLSF